MNKLKRGKYMKRRGISLIVLIITIIVVIILAAVVILTLSKNNPIESAKEARFKEDVRTFQDELALYISKQYTNAGGHWDGNISAKSYNEIVEYIPSFTKKYEGKFIINNNNLEYTNNLDEKEKEYAQSLNVKEKNKLLPDEFRQVEYIESTGTQYIDTGLLAKDYSDINCEIKGNYIKVEPTKTIFGAGNNNTWYLIGILFGVRDFGAQKGTAGTEVKFCSADLKEHIFTLDLKNGVAYLDNDLQINLSNNGNKIDKNYILFSNMNGNEWTTAASSFSMKYCKIIKDEVLIRNFVPCYCITTVTNIYGEQSSPGTKGMYDTVEGKFYTNQGTGEFIAGPEVD